MSQAGINKNMFFGDLVNKTVFLINSSGPKARQVSLKGFGFANTGKRCLLNVFNQFKNFKNQFLISRFELLQLMDGVRSKNNSFQ